MAAADAFLTGPRGAEEQNDSKNQAGGAQNALLSLEGAAEDNMAEQGESESVARPSDDLRKETLAASSQQSPSSASLSMKDGTVCKHVQKGAQPAVIKAKVAKLKVLCSCEECDKARVVRGKGAKKGKGKGAIVTPERPTKSAAPKDLWLCLACGCVSCSTTADGGAKQTAKGSGRVPPPMLSHVKNHASHKQHPLFLNIGTLDCWCAKCEKGGAFIDYSAATEGLPSGASEESVAGVSVHADLAPVSQHRGIAECAAFVRESQGGPVANASSTIKAEGNVDKSPAKASFAESEEEDASIAPEATSSESRIVGFSNLGNTCFFNSVLQNLAAVQPLQVFFQGGQEEGQNEPPIEGPLTAALRGFYTDLSKLSSGAGSNTKDVSSPGKALKKVGGKHKGGKNVQRRGFAGAYSPSRLFSAVCTKAPRFKGFEQQDAHELLRYLLDGLDTEELAVRKRAQKSKRNEGPESKSKRVGRMPNKAPAEGKGAIREEDRLSEDAVVPSEMSQPATLSSEAAVATREDEKEESTEARTESMMEETESSDAETDRAKEDRSQGKSTSPNSLRDKREETSASGSEGERKRTKHSESNGTVNIEDADRSQMETRSMPLSSLSNGNANSEAHVEKSLSSEPSCSNSQPTRDAQTGSGQLSEATFVQRIFGGKLSSTVVCFPCGHSSSVEEPFLDLSLPLPAPGGAKTGGFASPRKEKPSTARRKTSEAARKKPQRTSEGEKRQSAEEIDVQVQRSNESVSQETAGKSEARVAIDQLEDSAQSAVTERRVEAAEKGDELSEEVKGGRDPLIEPSTANKEGAESANGKLGGKDTNTDKDAEEGPRPAELIEVTQSKGSPAYSSTPGVEEGSTREESTEVESAQTGSQEECTVAEPTVEARVGGGASFEEQTTGVGQGTTSGGAQNEAETAGSTDRQKEVSRDQSRRVHWADCDTLPPPAAMSLEGCLFSFTREEVLEGENAVTCEECTKAARAEGSPIDVVLKDEENSEGETRSMVEEESSRSKGEVSAEEENRLIGEEGRSAANGAERRLGASEQLSEKKSAESSEREHSNGNDLVEGMAKLHLEAPVCSSEKAPTESEVRSENGTANFGTAEGDLRVEPGHSAGMQQGSNDENGVFEEPEGEGAGQTDVQPASVHRESADSDGFTASPAKQKGRGKPRENGGQSKSQTALSNGFASLADAASSDESEADASTSEKRPDASSKSDVAVRRKATKRFLIAESPPILTVHLKRFRQDVKGRLSKIGGHVSFGEWLDLGPYLDRGRTNKESTAKAETRENGFSECINSPPTDEQPTADKQLEARYRLVGCVEHSGSMRGGHYVAYVRGSARQLSGSDRQLSSNRGADETWWYISDTHVQRSSLAAVRKCEAYLLFYERVD